MSDYFLEIQKGNFVASEKNKLNNFNLKIENQGEIISFTSTDEPLPLALFFPKFIFSITV